MKKKAIISIFAMVLTLSMIMIVSYAYYKPKENTVSNLTSIVTKSLDLDVDYTGNLSTIFNNITPVSDSVGLTNPGFEFTVTNNGTDWQFYKISIADLGVDQNQTKINSLDLKFNLSEKNNPDPLNTYTYTEIKNGIILSDYIFADATKEYVLRAWINEDCDNDSIDGYFNAQIVIEGTRVPDTYKLFDEHNIIRTYTNGVVGCVSDNSICMVFTNVKEAVKSELLAVRNIYVYGNVSLNSEVTIPEGRTIMLDLNGSNLLRSQTGDGIDVAGTLIINDSLGDGNYYNSYTGGARLILTLGSLTINGGRYITDGDNAPFRIGKSDIKTGSIIINNGSFFVNNPAEEDALFKIYSDETNPLIINNIFTYIENTSLFDFSSSITDVTSTHVLINGGMFINNSWPNIYLNDPGTLTITSQSNRVYILGKQKDGKHPIYNDDVGTINIVGANANACTKDPLDTTSGICVYAEGNKDYGEDQANGAVINSNAGVININGGTYYGGHDGIYNYKKGIINIKNAIISADHYAIINGSSSSNTATMTICSSSLNGIDKDIRMKTNGSLSYYNVTFKNGTTTPLESELYISNGSLIALESCPF